MNRVVIVGAALVALLSGPAQAQLGPPQSKVQRPVCEVIQDASNLMDLQPKLSDAMEQCGSESWVSVNLGIFSAADVAGLICRPGLPVVVDGGKLGCMVGVWSVNRRVVKTK
ncbi:hypothetical protein VY88_09475 [Azospirillum thiophilum]|uniref:Uncharacterized protein n=1 Tax=Azospirillum thiophilum TaxID=528244 RepID=A0AAC8VV62_9PROT|nr:hypothetical protein [Azospirillum thiophilum]ALG70092.1 hypothetical protein AL072_03230 [Azospirillum thiophilum]KJR66226.1 hypothetical protein VY88_09475 [Azospirillum thiophilum]